MFLRPRQTRSLFDIGGDRVSTGIILQPIFDNPAIQQGFLGAEGFRYQDHGGPLRIERFQQMLRTAAVDIIDEVNSETPRVKVPERVHRKTRPEIGAAKPILMMSLTCSLPAT